MASSEAAQRNHDELFPGHVSTLGVTDPELIEVFGNFAFEEVLADSTLDTRTRLMMQLDVLAERGVRLPLDGQSTTTPGTRATHGRAVQERIVGADRVERMYAAAAEDELRFQRFLSANCFGDYLTRSGIEVPVRELLTLAMLAALGGCDSQVRSHVAANLNVGNDRQLLISVLTALLPFIGYPRTLNALAAINEVAPACSEGQ